MHNPLDMMKPEKQQEVLDMLLKCMKDSESRRPGLDKAIEALERGVNDATEEKFLATSLKIIRAQDAVIANLAAVAAVYLGSDTFTTDAAKVANKMGLGQEALQQLFRNKFGG